MKLKCHKIRNIPLEICTAEQKIAYNYAFLWVESGRKIEKSDVAEFVKADGFSQIYYKVLNTIKNKPEMQKYNIDAIMIAFHQGFRNYCNNYFIATRYEQIGNCFKIPYEIV